MKLVNYQLQTQIEYLSREKSTQFFTEYLHSIVEDTSKTYYQRADYVGLSLLELKLKIDTLSKDISELQQLKKQLGVSMDIAKEITASIFNENGIDRIDGNIISSLTLTKPSTKTKTTVNVLNSDEVMKLGYIKFEPDLEAITEAIQTKDGLNELDEFVSISSDTVITPSKIKVNTKQSLSNTQSDELLSIVKQAA